MNTRIADRLRSISPTQLQILAEELALVVRPKTFARSGLIVRGRNIEGQTTKGWPDAYAAASDGKIFAIEATRDKANCEGHIRADYAKAANTKNSDLKGYFFVGGYPDLAMTDDEKQTWIEKFAALGMPAENVNLLVGQDLVKALEAPECARIRHTLLDLPVEPQRFRVLIPGDGHSSEALAASREDFERDQVFKPALLADVVASLKAEDAALVRGRAAAGKTTLIHLIAADAGIAPSPVYILDIARAADDPDGLRPGAIQDLTEFAGDGVLFVIDNIHLAEGLARDLFDKWKTIAKLAGAKMLLVGRDVRKSESTTLGDVRSFTLRAGADELRGVVNRIFERHGAVAPTIDEDAIAAWIKTFAGGSATTETSVDLVAFTAAVEHRFDQINGGFLELGARDAVDGVRSRYWGPLRDQREKDNLLCLAALAALEISPADDMLPFPATGFPMSLKQGLVAAGTVGGEGRKRYSLLHPALGRLLLASAGNVDDGRTERLLAAGREIALWNHIAARTTDEEEAMEAEAGWRLAAASPNWIVTCYSLSEAVGLSKRIISDRLQNKGQVDQTWGTHKQARRLLDEARSSSAWILLASMAQRLLLSQTLGLLREYGPKGKSGTRLQSLIETWPSHQTTSFLRLHPNGTEMLAAINVDRWRTIQAERTMPIYATEAVGAVRYLEEQDRQDLAQSPALRQISAAQPRLWYEADLSHFSRLIRAAQAPEADILALMDALILSGWMAVTIEKSRSGSLSGALFSLSNYLPDAAIARLPRHSLRERMGLELSRGFGATGNQSMNRLSMFGGLMELFPDICPSKDIAWPTDAAIADMITRRTPGSVHASIGTHEIQLWLGIMHMMSGRSTPLAIAPSQGERFLKLLDNTPGPTPRGETIRQRLLLWLRRAQGQGWLVPAATAHLANECAGP